MTWWPTRTSRNVSTHAGRTGRDLLWIRAILVVLISLQAAGPTWATGPRRPPADPPMPDPCQTAPVLPFCR